MQSLVQDVRYALRSFARQPALTLAALLSLGMGIGVASVSSSAFEDWRAGARTDDLPAWDMLPVGLREGSDPTERAWRQLLSGNCFERALAEPARRHPLERGRPVRVAASVWVALRPPL